MRKKRIATVWLAGCSGCHMSLFDLDERLLEVGKLADIVRSPLVDAKEFPEVDIALVEGAVASDQHLEEIKTIRKRSKILVSLGDCAVTGNVSALRNWIPVQDVLKCSYVDAPSNDSAKIPDQGPIQKLLQRVRPLHEVVNVDVFIPGCPPGADLIYKCLSDLIHDRMPKIDKPKFG